jgi:hypothetical protein
MVCQDPSSRFLEWGLRIREWIQVELKKWTISRDRILSTIKGMDGITGIGQDVR